MKIIKSLRDSESNHLLELDAFPSGLQKLYFESWSKEMGIDKKVKIVRAYRAGPFGDDDFPAIHVNKGTRKKIITLVLLTWS